MSFNSFPPQPQGPRLGLVGWLRWTWRQLISMRVALLLLSLLAIAALPGSFLPQRPQNPADVATYLAEHPTVGVWLDRFGFFDVYASVWFSAVYLLLFVSLVGCIVPRVRAHIREWMSPPPRVPRQFTRFPVQEYRDLLGAESEVLVQAQRHLRGRWSRRYRVQLNLDAATLSAERGYLRETGNLLFHISLVGLLFAVAFGQLSQYRGQALIIEGRGFANAMASYDTFEHGAWFQASSLQPFTMTLDSFDAEFATDPSAFAQSRDFTAHVTIRDAVDLAGTAENIKVNYPLRTHGTKVYLQGNGYAPNVTVRDAEGNIAFSGPVPFLPKDQMYTSRGVIKVPDVSPGLDQMGFAGHLLPTAEVTQEGARSVFPQPLSPLLVLDVYRGDLGLDDGTPQNVYRLTMDKLTPVVDAKGERVQVMLEPGQTVPLPDGLGSITFEGLPRYVAVDLRKDPALTAILVCALTSLLGLTISLFTPRRRVWLRVEPGEQGARVHVAGFAKGTDIGLAGDISRLLDTLTAQGVVAAAEHSEEGES